MALTMPEKRVLTNELARRFLGANRKTKASIIEQVVGLTGYNRLSGVPASVYPFPALSEERQLRQSEWRG